MPFLLGTKIMPVRQFGANICASCPAPDGIDFTRLPSVDAILETNETISLSKETGSNLARVRFEHVTPSALQSVQ